MFRYAALSANQMHNWDEMAAHELEPATFDD
jgi:hypothetical protein